jgi:hypothetical protein
MAAFTLTSTLKSNDLGAKIQPTGATSGLNSQKNQSPPPGSTKKEKQKDKKTIEDVCYKQIDIV